jgi:HEAT repeat protein
MRAQDLNDVPTLALIDHALVAAGETPLLESDDYWAYVRALHFRSGTTVFEKAVALCSSSDPLARSVGADILSQLGTGEGVAEFPFADDSAPVLVTLLDDGEPLVSMSALYALGHLGRGAPADLARLASHSSEGVRCALAYALGGRTDDISIATLIGLSADNDVDTRDWATFALGTLSQEDSPAIRDALALRLTDSEDEVRGEAMLGLAKRLDTRATQPILRELGETDVLTLAIEAAEEMPSADFLPHLEALHAAQPEDQRIQRAVARCRAVTGLGS